MSASATLLRRPGAAVLAFCGAVSRAAAAYQAEPTPENLLRLQNSVEPARQELFRRLNMAPGGTAALVDDAQAAAQGARDATRLAAPIDVDLNAPAALLVQPRLPALGAHRLAHLRPGARES